MAALIKALLQPIAIVWLGLLALCAWQIYKRHYRWAAVPGALFLFIFIAGSSPLAGYLLSRLEAPYVRTDWDDLPQADAVVVLGGMATGSEHEITGVNFSAAADRIMTGIALVRGGNSNVLVIGGGGYWSGGELLPEADPLGPWMKDWKLLDNAEVHDLGICGNTREEAVKFSELAEMNDWESVLMVTSANHLKRAEAVFLSSGVSVEPVGCDYMGYPYRGDWKLIPSQDRLVGLRTWLYETVGWTYYRSQGWIRLEALPKR